MTGTYTSLEAERDSQKLFLAMKGIGSDEQALIDVLAHKSPEQSAALASTFKAHYGKELRHVIRQEVGLQSDFRDVLIALTMTQAGFDAYCLYHAMKGIGADVEILLEILCARTPPELKAIKDTYLARNQASLEEAVKSENIGPVKKLIVMILQCQRDDTLYPKQEHILEDVEALHKAGEKSTGDESVFMSIFANRSYMHLRQMFEAYRERHKQVLREKISALFSGHIRSGLLNIYDYGLDRHSYFAVLLNESMVGAGTRDKMLIRQVLRLRGSLKKPVKDAYVKLFRISLVKRIQDEGSVRGWYRAAILALVDDAG
mmetsp:Transcript_34261/g.55440  ORF Transcript_34261/g.55440 Transcript_34261/m.55440 type:complete len:317 (-) Transcript_34261:62-1012(-)